MKKPGNSRPPTTKENRHSVKKDSPSEVDNRPDSTAHDPLTLNYSTYSDDSGQSPDSINIEILYFLLRHCRKKGLYTQKRRRIFFRSLRNILQKPTVLDVLFELNEVKAVTVRVLCKSLGLPRSSVHDALEFLSSEGLVVQARPLRTKGRPATIYALKGYTPEDIAEAVNLDRISRTPGYTEAQRITQLILEDYLSKPEPRPPLYTRDDIYPILQRETRGFMWRDLEGLVLKNLRQAQITVHHGGIH